VAEINSEIPYDEMGNPRFNGVNDPRLGTNSRDYRCITCKGSMEECPGHFGHIELAKRVYHVGLLTYLQKVMRTICFNCSRLLIGRDKDSREYKFLVTCKSAKQKFNYIYTNSTSKEGRQCDPLTGGCGYKQPKLTKAGLAINIEYLDENFDQTKDRKQVLYADECYQVVRKIRDEDLLLMGFSKDYGKPEWMIIKNLTVAPPPVRPSVAMPNCYRCEDDLTYAYQQVIKMNNVLKSQIEKGANQSTINEILAQLQFFTATLMDNDICGQPKQKHKSGKQLKSIRARLKGKEGRLRGNLMGKRVDFSSRTVITPDPNL
jgi:DNA-directed RNA polymerase II subunit RPB1